MCGIAGFWGRTTEKDSRQAAQAMGMALQHRGPDDRGIWIDPKASIGLVHRRLSILDLSPAGHQPMHSPCGRYVLVFNGEIYNHLDLREALEKEGGHFAWRGHSDTETLLAALRHWGLENTLQQINGMFAFALWDSQERVLFLARDRMGEKPLYYGRIGNLFLFGSELKAFTALPEWKGQINRDALALYMRHNYVPAPWSIYKEIRKLPPAHFVAISSSGELLGDPRCYWDLGKIAEQGVLSESNEPSMLTDQLDSLLRDAVGRRMASDVPLGAFLSGGYDSTVVAALMQIQSAKPIKTFSIGFNEESHNEAKHAKAVAEHLGTEHTELYVTAEEAMSVIPKLPDIYDEPFSDSSQIPTLLVSKLAKQHVTVSLSGDGGDELFCGYNRYLLGHQIWQRLRVLPQVLRRAMAVALNHAPGHMLDKIQRRLPQRLRVSNLADRLPKLADVIIHRDSELFYRNLVSHFKQPCKIVRNAQEPNTILSGSERLPNLSSIRELMMYLDMVTYLPDDILTKVDRASMAVSLEARVPLLDHRVVEFAWQVPTEFKYRDGKGKWLLRQVLYRYVPEDIMDRPKMGFGVPIEHWLRGSLKVWAEELLNEKRLRDDGYFDPTPIRKMWNEHISGKRRWHYHLWDLLMFQAWLDAHQ